MSSPERRSSPKRPLGAILCGRRGIVKVAHLWLPLAFMLSTSPSTRMPHAWIVCLQMFVALACWSQSSILVNDLADRHEDRAAGRERWISRLPLAVGASVFTLLVGSGLLLVALAAKASGVAAAYAGAVALGVLYSIRPLRLKERGMLGLLTYASSAGLGFVVLPWVWLGSGWLTLAMLCPAVLLDKWVNLHFHQVISYEEDRTSGTLTYSVAVGLERARRSLKWISRLTSLWLLATLVFVVLSTPTWRGAIGGAGVAVVLAACLYARKQRRSPDETTELLRELPWPYLGLTYALFRIIPLILLARLAASEPTMWGVFGAVASLVALESWQSLRYQQP